MVVDRVNQLNRSFTVIFTEAMQSIKPLKDIEKLRAKIEISKNEESYDTRIKNWQSAFAFSSDLRIYINELSNILVLAGGPNSSDGPNKFTQRSLKKLNEIMLSDSKKKSFDQHMESCKPKAGMIPDYEEKLKIWNDAFTFPTKLNGFIKKLNEQVKNSNEISGEQFIKQLDEFIKSLQVDKDEFLIKETDSIGGEDYKVDSEIIISRADDEIEELVKIIPKSKTAPEDFKTRFKENQESFKKVMIDARKNELEVKAEKKILEKKYNNSILKFEIDSELAKKGTQAIKKHFPQYMNAIAGASIGAILTLVIASLLCIGCTSEIVVLEGTMNVDPNTIDISNPDSIKNAVSTGSSEITTKTVTRNPATEMLESELILILVSTFIAPVATRVIKEKFDIDVTEKQINMIMEDGIKSVTMFSKEADKLRDSNGHIPRKYQKTLRDKAFTSLRENYTEKKYADVAANVGSQIFEKAIESAVSSGRLEKFPLEKKQVEELIKQSINAAPGIIEWQKLDEQAKMTFIDGNIRKLLQNTGINGWSYKALENVFDAEVSKRLVNAALLEKDNLLQQFNTQDPYLKYTSTVIDALLERNQRTTGSNSL